MKALAASALAAALLLASLPPGVARSQEAAALGDGPLALDAADGVEWRREERLFIAEGDAVAKQGGVTLKAERMVAAYRTRPGGGLEIYKLDAEGDVEVESGGDAASGGRATFDLGAGVIALSGPNLAYASAEARVTARDTLEYFVKEKRAVARGAARVRDARGALSAAVIEAQFSGAATDGLSRARAWGDVRIDTGQEVILAERAEYDFRRRLAVAAGDVRIRRGENVLTGATATVDFASGVSRLAGGGGEGKRVRGMVFPKAVQ